MRVRAYHQETGKRVVLEDDLGTKIREKFMYYGMGVLQHRPHESKVADVLYQANLKCIALVTQVGAYIIFVLIPLTFGCKYLIKHTP